MDMPRFKIGDKLKHKDYINSREILEVLEYRYVMKITTKNSCVAQGSIDTQYSRITIDYVDNNYVLAVSPLESYVNDKLQKFLSGI